ncbi:MAG TPA: outer membrane lipoprotein carrier protein LolA [Acetobacteraceae bacterium]|jgi:outer membrane lipoprotein-sorting protein|nr:outer membrane lipoprotein carrier protein LolA [Acetobacteraceae bacterium]
MFTRRTLLLSAATLPFGAVARADTLSAQDKADIARVETYLDGLKSLKARFTQVAQNGSISEGTAWLERPGRMRFQYNPPSPFLLIAAHGVLTFNDSSLQQTSNISLGRTPLGILLADKVDLNGAVTVTGVQRFPGQLQVTLIRTETPGDGSLTLIFADPPLTLRQWTVVDAQRRETHVTLYNAKTGGSFDPQLFEQISPPAAKAG